MIGVNLSGAEFGKVGGAYGYSYIYPSAADIKFYADRGVELFRLPVKWERLQPIANGELDPAELGRLKKFLAAADAAGVKVIVDVHNFGSYKGNKIGSAEVSNEQFADFWKKLAGEIGDIKSVYGYDLMNEPNKMGGADVWPQAAQAAVDAIRTVDMNTKIYVEGNGFSAAKGWATNNANLDIQDPADLIIYQAHIYFDRWSSGTYGETYDQQGATPEMGAKAIQGFVAWLAERGAEGMIGEFAVPDNDPRWLAVLDNFLTAVRDAGLEATYWGAGPWWGDYALALRNKDGSESAQLDVLEKHIALAAEEASAPVAVPSGSTVIDGDPIVNGTTSGETLTGDARVNVLNGHQGNDVVEGGAGADRIDGGAGIDTASYAGSSAGVRIDLSAVSQQGGDAQGDTLTGIENVTGSTFADVLKGDAGVNLLRGGLGDDRLVASGGRDTMDGGDGIDTADFSAAPARIVANLVTGTVLVSDGVVTLRNIENIVGGTNADRITGDDRANVLVGGGSSDYLDGGKGADRLIGGTGNDTYVVDDAGDLVIEETGEGSDTVRTTLTSYTLGTNLEKLVLEGIGDQTGRGNALSNSLTGNTNANHLWGMAGNDNILGNDGDDILDGGDGNDVLDGGTGADTMIGGMGNDTYVVDDVRDIMVEQVNGGSDTVKAGIATFTLGANIEKLILTGTGGQIGIGNALANILTGSAGNDTLSGGGGDDTIDGGKGADRMEGGMGDDVFTLDDLGDAIVERAGEGTDTVRTGVSGYILGANVEKLILTGTGDLAGSGNALDNVLTSNAGANLLRGGGGVDKIDGGAGNDQLFGDDGDDALTGGAGADRLTGGIGKDVFKFALADSVTGAPDVITDFVQGLDRIDVSAIDARTNKSGNQAFAFIGSAAFSGSAGELRYQSGMADGHGIVTVQGDVNGDGMADFVLILEQFGSALKVADFML